MAESKITADVFRKDKIKYVLIDVDNTLLDFNKCAEKSIRTGFSEFGLEYREQVFSNFLTINHELWRQIEKCELTKEELYRVRWNKIFAACGISADGEKFEAAFRRGIAENHEKVDGALDLLKYLSQSYVVCTASNASHEQQLRRLENAGLSEYIKYFFHSETIGFPKPDERFFDACIKQLCAEKREVCLIGDSLSADISGGVLYGIKTIWYNHNREKFHGDFSPDFTVENLCEIKNIL